MYNYLPYLPHEPCIDLLERTNESCLPLYPFKYKLISMNGKMYFKTIISGCLLKKQKQHLKIDEQFGVFQFIWVIR